MMGSRDDRSEFTDVDRAADPGRFVRLLDTLTALDFVRAYKRQTYDLLGAREGDRLLDLGCGNGDDALELARRVGPNGCVVGVDRSETIIAEARRRAEGSGLPVEFRVGNAHRLDFADGTFDGCRADRVFHHLEQPRQALAELVRVARPGARVVTGEPDFETAIVDSPDRRVTRAILNVNCDAYQNGWMGRQLPALFKEAGLVDVTVIPYNVLLPDYATANQVLTLETSAERAREQGLVTPAEAADWIAQLREADRAGRFFGALTAFIQVARKP
jgi:ubiquinone/menaquinone biosynthesis C-methylase UbiE